MAYDLAQEGNTLHTFCTYKRITTQPFQQCRRKTLRFSIRQIRVACTGNATERIRKAKDASVYLSPPLASLVKDEAVVAVGEKGEEKEEQKNTEDVEPEEVGGNHVEIGLNVQLGGGGVALGEEQV